MTQPNTRKDDPNPPQTEKEVVPRIVTFVHEAILQKGSSFNDSRDAAPGEQFTLTDAIKAWDDEWGDFARKRFRQGKWADEWMNVALVATVQAHRAIDIAAEAGHQFVQKDDFMKGGYFAADCCKQVYGRPHIAACWCNTEC